jgi:hypothetical protein
MTNNNKDLGILNKGKTTPRTQRELVFSDRQQNNTLSARRSDKGEPKDRFNRKSWRSRHSYTSDY